MCLEAHRSGACLVLTVLLVACSAEAGPAGNQPPGKTEGTPSPPPATAKHVQPGHPLGTPKRTDAPQARALLVGCTTYDHLPKDRQLLGPRNDVELFRKLLVDKFGFLDERITTLAEGRGPELRPTRANILREFQRLARQARTGDRVVILLSGHGSQQPNDPADHDDVEPDGLDEVFCPADVQRLTADDDGKITSAIVDDQLKDWLAAILDAGASVWFIADCCHSGTVARADDVARGFPSWELLPPAEQAKLPVERGISSSGRERVTLELPAKPTLIKLYATQPYEETVEATFSGQKYGILTHALCHVLTQCDTPITYRELVRRIHARYVEQDRYSPTPLVEGDGLDQEVLGTRVVLRGRSDGRSGVTLRRVEQGAERQARYEVDAGELQDLTLGSVLAVYPAAGQKADPTPLGHVKVTRLEMLKAAVEPCEHGGLPRRSDLPNAARCEVVFFDYDRRQLKLGVDPLTDEGVKVPSLRLGQIHQQLAALDKGRGTSVQVVADFREAHWLIRDYAGQLYLVHRSIEIGKPRGSLPHVGPIPSDGGPLADWLDLRLRRIAFATNLVRLGASSLEDTYRSRKMVDVEVQMLRHADEADKRGTPIQWQRDGLVLKTGNIISFRATNRSRVPIHVGVLFIDSRLGITLLYPKAGTVEPWRFGEMSSTPRFRVNAETTGTEHVLVIAVATKPQREPPDFGDLCQGTWPENQRSGEEQEARQRAVRKPIWDFPLGQLLLNSSQTRGLGNRAMEEHALKLITWKTMP